MQVRWNVDRIIQNRAWKPIRAMSAKASATAKGANRIVDLGGGSGWFGLHLASAHPDAEVISVDTAPRFGQDRVKHIKGSVLDIPLESGTADIVGANAILHHVPDQLDRCASEIYSILKPGGIFLAQEPLAGNPPARWTRGWVRTSAHEEGERPLPYAAMKNAIERGGLRIRKAEFYFLTSYLFPHIVPLAPKGMRGILRWKGLFLVRLDRALLRRLPGLRKYAAYVSIAATKE
jgi:SAM-dependent methyltransferase